jgi:hypothetical protein
MSWQGFSFCFRKIGKTASAQNSFFKSFEPANLSAFAYLPLLSLDNK